MLRLFSAATVIVAFAFASVTAQAGPKQGGDMVVTYKDDISTFDPAIGYDWQNSPSGGRGAPWRLKPSKNCMYGS